MVFVGFKKMKEQKRDFSKNKSFQKIFQKTFFYSKEIFRKKKRVDGFSADPCDMSESILFWHTRQISAVSFHRRPGSIAWIYMQVGAI